jgi:hypothetical protein
VNKRLSTRVSTKRVKPVLSHLLQSGVSTIQNISPFKATSTNTTTVTTTREPTLSNWRRTKTTKVRLWTLPPLQLKATTPPFPILSTRGRTPNKLITCKLSVGGSEKSERVAEHKSRNRSSRVVKGRQRISKSLCSPQKL